MYRDVCAQFTEYLKLYALPDIDIVNKVVSKELLHLHNTVTENTKVIEHNKNWAHLQYLEAYYINTISPEINMGLKPSKELQSLK